MFTRVVRIVVGTMLFMLGFSLAACSTEEQSLQDRVNERLSQITDTEWDDMCTAYDYFGEGIIYDMLSDLGRENDISVDETVLVFDRIIEACSGR